MKNPIILFAVIALLFFNSCLNQNKTCILRGKVYAPNCESVFLIKIQEDMTEQGLEIPVNDSIIDYKLMIEQPEGYNLFLQQGGGKAMPIFLEPGEIEIIIYGEDEFNKNEVHGGKLNKMYTAYSDLREKYIEKKLKPIYLPLQDSLDILKKNNNYYSDSMKIINNLINNTLSREERSKLRRIGWDLEKNNLYYSEVAREIVNRQKELNDEMRNWEINYYCENPTLVSYFLLLKDIYYSKAMDSEDMKKCLEVVSQNNPNHPYNEYAEIWLEKENKINVGGRFIDFTAPDLNGHAVRLSDSIKGKFAIINLWSTTCSPCIKHSQEMLPVYNQYKIYGFTIVGISGEYHNLENLKYRLEAEKFPWLNLVELDRQNKIWDKYGISTSGGRMFMVDRDGIIIAIEPSAEEVKKILDEKLIKKTSHNVKK